MNKVFNIIKKIFSISLTEDFLRYRIMLFGIKISFPRPVVLFKKNANPFYKYKKEGRDITTLPKATGQVRDIQLANLAILLEIDKVCKKIGIQYWLDYGNLLGAVRHKGYIPWDDDIDISMLREDFEVFMSNFENVCEDKDLYLFHYCNPKGTYVLKVCQKNCKFLFVDVFAYDYCKIGMKSDEEKIEYTKNILSKKKEFLANIKFEDGKDLYAQYSEFRKNLYDGIDSENKINNDLMFCVEYGHEEDHGYNWIKKRDSIFPLKGIEYEGITLPAVSNCDEHLKSLFGDYMAYPNDITLGHSAYAKLSKEDEIIIKKYVKKLSNYKTGDTL